MNATTLAGLQSGEDLGVGLGARIKAAIRATRPGPTSADLRNDVDAMIGLLKTATGAYPTGGFLVSVGGEVRRVEDVGEWGQEFMRTAMGERVTT